MKNNIVCVTVCGDTTSIGLYEVETNDVAITKVKLYKYNEYEKISFTDIVNNVKQICKYEYVTHSIVDSMGRCIAIV